MHSENDSILIPEARGLSVIKVNSIVRVEAVSNYSKVFLAKGKTITVSKVLKHFEELLAGKGFARIHRSHLVNTAHILSYNFYELKVRLQSGEEIGISRRRKRGIKTNLKHMKLRVA